MGKLDQKVAIITGAADGLGRAGAVLFAREGAIVVVVDIDDAGALETVRMIENAGGKALAVQTDVSNLAAMQAMTQRAVERYGQIDILWNNAGIATGVFSAAEDISEEDWNAVIAVNLNGTFFGIKCAVPHMKARRKGVIINTASIAGLVAYAPGRAGYVAAKAGIIALTKQLSLELGPFNIRVNAIAPGGMNTSMKHKVKRPETVPFDFKRTFGNVDATRVAEPIEVARTALFLASDDVGPLTGVILPHDGGVSAR